MLTRLARAGILTVAILAWTDALCAAERGTVSLDLVRDGKPAVTIVVANQATRSARLAAAELQYHVQKITGAVLPMVDDTQRVDGSRVLVGESQATASLGLRGDEFASQEYLIRFQPGTLILIGRDKPERGKFDYADAATFPALFDEQGTCYATYEDRGREKAGGPVRQGHLAIHASWQDGVPSTDQLAWPLTSRFDEHWRSSLAARYNTVGSAMVQDGASEPG